MALLLLQVVVLGSLAAAADDVSVVWWSGARTSLHCVVPNPEKVQLRRPPPPLDGGDSSRTKKPYFWTYNGNELNNKRISPNGTLEVTKRKDGTTTDGIYQCAVRSHNGVVLGYPITLKYAYMDKQFAHHPENRTGYLGQPVTLSCEIYSAPDAEVTWIKDGQKIQQDFRLLILRYELLISELRYEDAGFYKCITHNRKLNKTRVSNEGRLIVQETEGVIEPSVVPTRHPGNHTVIRRSRVILPCPVMGSPRPEMVWELTPPTPNGRTAELDDTKDVLVFPKIELDQAGVYTCKVARTNNILRTFNVTIKDLIGPSEVSIIYPPEPPELKLVHAGTVRINCTATGHPAPQITWYKDGHKVEYTNKIKLKPAPDDSGRIELVVNSLTSGDSGIYQCFASNGGPLVSGWTGVTVTGEEVPGPTHVACQPRGPTSVKVTWDNPPGVVAATVTVVPFNKSEIPSLPHQQTFQLVTLDEPLEPFTVEVRGYRSDIATQISDKIVCQGQGVPIRLSKLKSNKILVSWKEFADHNPQVKEYILQYKKENGEGYAHNITLTGDQNKHTMAVPYPMFIRVLGTKIEDWIAQDLSNVPWTSSESIFYEADIAAPTKVVIDASQNSAHISWDFADLGYSKIEFQVCLRGPKRLSLNCIDTEVAEADIDGLKPNTAYQVQIQARANDKQGQPSDVITFKTKPQDESITYSYVDEAILVSWRGEEGARYVVRWSQEIQTPMEAWHTLYLTTPTAKLTGLDVSLQTFVMVESADKNMLGQVTIEPLKGEQSSLYYGVGIASGVSVLVLVGVVALCLWRRRKRIRSPDRRPRHTSSSELNEEEGSEMTAIRGRLSNGGPLGAGEPLLNGHLPLTHHLNPDNGPNGKTKKGSKYEIAFDLSRYDDPNTTTETVLSQEATNEPHYNVIDTSRMCDDVELAPQISAHFVKLPDDNMNSEKDFTQKDNSKLQPNLQPNG